jgi:hypothetical protein
MSTRTAAAVPKETTPHPVQLETLVSTALSHLLPSIPTKLNPLQLLHPLKILDTRWLVLEVLPPNCY